MAQTRRCCIADEENARQVRATDAQTLWRAPATVVWHPLATFHTLLWETAECRASSPTADQRLTCDQTADYCDVSVNLRHTKTSCNRQTVKILPPGPVYLTWHCCHVTEIMTDSKASRTAQDNKAIAESRFRARRVTVNNSLMACICICAFLRT